MLPDSKLHCEKENDLIDWANGFFHVNKANKPWPQRQGQHRTGALSAFGVSGTNAHMVIQSHAPEPTETDGNTEPYYLLALSARTQETLQEKITDLIAFLEEAERPEQNLANISCTLLEARIQFPHRYAVVIQGR